MILGTNQNRKNFHFLRPLKYQKKKKINSFNYKIKNESNVRAAVILSSSAVKAFTKAKKACGDGSLTLSSNLKLL